jgi:hypothetical protein
MKEAQHRNDTLVREGEQILNITWSHWYSLTEEVISQQAPKEFGIYKIRQTNGVLVTRLRGKSEILYLGRSGTTANRTLRQRLLELVRYGPHIAAGRIKRLKEELGLHLEFCYAETKEPVSAEKLLLMLYDKEHYELPPLNHAGGL